MVAEEMRIAKAIECLKAGEILAAKELINTVLEERTGIALHSDMLAEIERLTQELERVKAQRDAIVDAVSNLPVEDIVSTDWDGRAVLDGYGMLCQGEWDMVLRAIATSKGDKP
jgi:hypothetical protein